MVEVRPFRAIRYNGVAVPDLARVVCPPYDAVAAGEVEELLRRSPYNAVNLDLPHQWSPRHGSDNRHARAAALLRGWMTDGVLVEDPAPAMYLVREWFDVAGQPRVRRGVTLALRLEPYARREVLPHEHTAPGPKADRLALLKATRANVSPIMALYRDADGSVARLLDRAEEQAPTAGVRTSNGSRCQVWTIADPEVVTAISMAIATGKVYLADGHHRYEAALCCLEEVEATEGPLPRDAAVRYIMATLIAIEDPGLAVLPFHRVIAGLADAELDAVRQRVASAFDMEPLCIEDASPLGMAGEIERRLAADRRSPGLMAVVGLERGRVHLLTPHASRGGAAGGSPLERCDMWLLHDRVIRPALGPGLEASCMRFVPDTAEAVRQAMEGSVQLAFIVRALPMDLFQEVVERGERLPPKSTCFYPKLLNGLAVRSLDGST